MCFVYSWKEEISIEKIIRREKEEKSFSLCAWNKKKMYTTFWKEKLKKRNCAWIGKWKNFTKSRNCWRNEKNWKKQEKREGRSIGVLCFCKYLTKKWNFLANNLLRVLNVLAIYQVKNGDYFAIAFKEIVCKKSREKEKGGSCWISIK